MRILTIPTALVLLTAFAVGCADQSIPTGLSDSATVAAVSSDAAPNLKAEHTFFAERDFSWTGESENVTCANDGVGEVLEWDGIVVASTRKLQNKSMETRSTKLIGFKGDNFDEFQGTGLTSRDVWIINPKGSTWTARWSGDYGDFWNWHQTYSFKFTNQDGEKLHMQGSRVEKYDKNGDLVLIEYNRGSCPNEWY